MNAPDVRPTHPQNTLPLIRMSGLIPIIVGLLLTQSWMLNQSEWSGRGWWMAAQLWALGTTAIILWKLVLVAAYRPGPSVDDHLLPTVTVIVPAYNEGSQVYDTIESLVRSDYPHHKLRLVAVDDGSRDDTRLWIKKARDAFPDRVIAVDCDVNRGKRHALYEGFVRARGSVLVTVDGDSEVLPGTLRNLVSPFVIDHRIGAVAGNVRVLNRTQGVIPRMLDVAFTYAFEFMRASESEVDTVQCGPGALSAYRRSLVRSFQDDWLTQQFMGSPANIGEDRAMTNLVLRMGFLVRFQSNAIVLTEAPAHMGQLSRMFLRWARSNVREILVLARFVFTRFRPESAVGARINLVWSLLQLLTAAGAFVVAIGLMVTTPALILWGVAGALLAGLLPAYIYVATRATRGTVVREIGAALWAFPYGLVSLFALSWIGPYALLTPHRSSWLTRGLNRTPSPEVIVLPPNPSIVTAPLRAIQ